MSTSTQGRPMPRIVRILFAPAFWLERSRGRKGLALAFLYVLVMGTGGFFVWWATSLSGLPDLGDPSGLAAINRIEMPPDDQNAFTLYRQASIRLVPMNDPEQAKLFQWGQPWSQADPRIQEWASQNQEALQLWREGTGRSQAVLIRSRDLSFESDLSLLQHLRDFARLGLLQASRAQEKGNLAESWRWYRAALRSTRHSASHGCFVNRLVGSGFLRACDDPIITWADDARTSPPLLRRALADVTACEAMTPLASESALIEYQSLMKAINNPEKWMPELRDEPLRWAGERAGFYWYEYLPRSAEARLFVWREPERSRRIARLYFANWLSQCDKDLSQRPAMVGDPLLYDQPGARGITPQALERWLKSSLLASRMIPSTGSALRSIDSDRPILGGLKVYLAERLYEREHGRPPRTLGELIGPDLPYLPRGYEPGDPPTLPAPDTKPQKPVSGH